MHESFVTGPVGTSGLRLAERCEECAKASSVEGCAGFGPGCLAVTRIGEAPGAARRPRSARLWVRVARLMWPRRA